MKHRNGFTLVELMIVIVILAILAAIAVPLFLKHQRQSKTSEARQNIAYIYKAAIIYYQEDHTVGGVTLNNYFPPASNALPATVPKGKSVKVPPATWEANATWNALRFSIADPILYQYRFTNVTVGPGTGAAFSAQAIGDLDSDGTQSLFQRGAKVAGGEPVGSNLIETRPLE